MRTTQTHSVLSPCAIRGLANAHGRHLEMRTTVGKAHTTVPWGTATSPTTVSCIAMRVKYAWSTQHRRFHPPNTLPSRRIARVWLKGTAHDLQPYRDAFCQRQVERSLHSSQLLHSAHVYLYSAANPHHLLRHPSHHHALVSNLHIKKVRCSEEAHAEEDGAFSGLSHCRRHQLALQA